MTSVLVVEDNVALRVTLCRDLASHGFVVAQADHAEAALAVLAAQPIDVVVTDLLMPGTDGIDLLARLQSQSTRTRAILMSGGASARDYERALEHGAVRVLCKPFTSSELVQSIRHAVDCETGFRGSIHGLSLIDLLQMFHFARRSLAIAVDGIDPGHLFLAHGDLVHATYRELEGEPALRAILAMPAGSLRTMVLPGGVPRTITRDFQGLLLDSLRTLDEGDRIADDELAAFDDPGAAGVDARPPASPPPTFERTADRLRRLDGYVTMLWVDPEACVVVASDGVPPNADADAAARGFVDLYRAACTTDDVDDVVITLSHHYLVVRAFPAGVDPAALACVVLDRTASLGLARRTLAATCAAVTADPTRSAR